MKIGFFRRALQFSRRLVLEPCFYAFLLSPLFSSCATDLVKSAAVGDTAEVKKNIGEGVNKRNSEGNTPLIVSAAQGHISVVRYLISQGADIAARNNSGNDALGLAAGKGHLEIIELLLDNNAEINNKNSNGNTALINAVAGGYIDVVTALLNRGANPNVQNQNGETALMFATLNRDDSVVKILIDKGADPYLRAKNGISSIDLAESKNYDSIAKLIKRQRSAQAEPGSSGAGLVIGTGWVAQSGHVVTLYHNIKGARKIVVVRTDGQRLPATVAITDQLNNVALLKVDDLEKLPPALPISPRRPIIGENVVPVGYSFSEIEVGALVGLFGPGSDPRTLEITSTVLTGHDGSPLLNMYGEVIGLTLSRYSAAQSLLWDKGTAGKSNYAIRVDYVDLLISATGYTVSAKPQAVTRGSWQEIISKARISIVMVIAEK